MANDTQDQVIEVPFGPGLPASGPSGKAIPKTLLTTPTFRGPVGAYGQRSFQGLGTALSNTSDIAVGHGVVPSEGVSKIVSPTEPVSPSKPSLGESSLDLDRILRGVYSNPAPPEAAAASSAAEQTAAANRQKLAEEPKPEEKPVPAKQAPAIDFGETPVAPPLEIGGTRAAPSNELPKIAALESPAAPMQAKVEAPEIAAAEPSPAEVGAARPGQDLEGMVPTALGFAPPPILISGPEEDDDQTRELLLSLLKKKKH